MYVGKAAQNTEENMNHYLLKIRLDNFLYIQISLGYESIIFRVTRNLSRGFLISDIFYCVEKWIEKKSRKVQWGNNKLNQSFLSDCFAIFILDISLDFLPSKNKGF